MTMDAFETATTHQQLQALAANLRGAALTEALHAIGVTWGMSRPVAARREELVNYFSRSLDSRAIAQMTARR